MGATIPQQVPLLHSIESPLDLRNLSVDDLKHLCGELREYLIYCASHNGGHFASGLGALELTVALHYVFATPEDRLVWDVGHQSYPHKALTARRKELLAIRRRGGLSGFPRRSESEYDAFGVAHAGTAISAALGMAIAADLDQSDRRVVAVVGDGALTAGMALEALNHAGALKRDLLVVINDNGMAISPNVGAISRHLSHLVDGWKSGSERRKRHRLRSLAATGRRDRASPPGSDAAISSKTLFHGFGFDYFGPVDGHDIQALIAQLQELRDKGGTRLLHVVTTKGKGYRFAEADPVAYHGVEPFDIRTGITTSRTAAKPPTYTSVFGKWLCDMAERDDRLVAVTPAMGEGSGLAEFSKRYPRRFFDAAIAEQHAVTLAAGLAAEGLHPVVAIYSTFLQRGYDSLIHDVAIQDLPVLFAVDRAGIVGPDGPTHAGSFDLTYLRCLPNVVIMAPASGLECRQMLTAGHWHSGPAVVRYPKANTSCPDIDQELDPLTIGRAEMRRRGRDIAILSFGGLLEPALAAADRLDATLVNMRFVKPLDQEILAQVADQHSVLVTLEDNVVAGGAGSGVNEWLASRQMLRPVLNLGLPDCFLDHGTRTGVLAQCGLDAAGIYDSIHRFRDKWLRTIANHSGRSMLR